MSRNRDKCLLCEGECHAEGHGSPGSTDKLFNCDRCGNYLATAEAKQFKGKFNEYRHLISGISRERTDLKLEPLYLSSSNLENILSAPFPRSVQEKAVHLLKALGRQSTFPGELVRVIGERDIPLAYCRNREELSYFVAYLQERKWIEHKANPDQARPGAAKVLTPEGWTQIENSKASDASNPKCFVAMSFDAEMEPAYLDGVKPAITACGYFPIKMDEVEHAQLIDDRMIAELRECRFLVADLTLQNKGVYFEGGYAMGLQKTVIWTCRKKDAEETHFDTEHYNQLRWSTPPELKEKLILRIKAVMGQGPLTDSREVI